MWPLKKKAKETILVDYFTELMGSKVVGGKVFLGGRAKRYRKHFVITFGESAAQELDQLRINREQSEVERMRMEAYLRTVLTGPIILTKRAPTSASPSSDAKLKTRCLDESLNLPPYPSTKRPLHLPHDSSFLHPLGVAKR